MSNSRPRPGHLSKVRKITPVRAGLFIALLVSIGIFVVLRTHAATAPGSIKTVFVVMMENTDWTAVKGSGSYPYLNNTLLPNSAWANNYQTTWGHPSLPNYVGLEAGDPMGLTDGAWLPPAHSTNTTDHLVTQLRAAGIDWKYWAENLPGNGTTCNITDPGTPYSLDHNAFVYFDDVRNDTNYCKAHERPYTEFATALTSNAVSGYNLIVPNDYDQGEKLAPGSNCMACQSDNFLKSEIPKIQASSAYKDGGVIIVLWDEMGYNGPRPSGMIINSPYGKKNYSNNISYNHGSTLRTLQTIFGVGPFLRQAATATDLSDFFTIPLAGVAAPSPTPGHITGDVNGDGKVNVFDLSAVLNKWGSADTAADLNASGKVDVFDLSILLTHWLP